MDRKDELPYVEGGYVEWKTIYLMAISVHLLDTWITQTLWYEE